MEQFKKYLITVDKNMSVISTEQSFLDYIGRSEVDNLDQVVPPQDLMQLRNAVFAIDPGTLGLSCFRIRTSNGRLNWIAANVEKRLEHDELIRMELSDIQTLKADGALAQYDEMTGIFNKQAIKEYARTLTEQYPRRSFYFCLMDIDHFKSVNDTFGHLCGDEVIIDVAHIIRDCVGTDGMVGRIGGDEFMLVLEKVDTKPRVREVLASIRETVEEKYKNYKDSLNITVSIGTALYPDFAVDYDALFKLTDKMLYLAKIKGRNRYIIYTPEIHGDVNAEVQVAAVSHKPAEGATKLQLMLDLLTRFLHQTELSIQLALERVTAAYDLDELYVFYENLEKSRYGVGRVDLEKDGSGLEVRANAMPFLGTEAFGRLFDENGVAIVNVFDLNKETYADIIEYMEKNERRFMVVCRLKTKKGDGYIAYINKRENSRRLSEADILDLVYFAKMVELTSGDR
ncbi:MAG: GGDEF domain-containing protein [Lachnospiraceae bacterium]|nr:GGDEF domain-containing protein [Lachnospiraceae bacterium]